MRIIMTLAIVLGLSLPGAALAEKGGNPNKGKGKDKEWSPAAPGSPPGRGVGHGKFASNDRLSIQQYYSAAVGRGACPPGLAKKQNGCLPPGHAKRWIVGQPLPANITWYAVPHDLVVRLTPPPYGHRYVYLDGGVLLLNVSSRLVVDSVSINIGIR